MIDNLHLKPTAVLQEPMQQTWQHNLEANRSFCEIYAAEDDHSLAQHWATDGVAPAAEDDHLLAQR
jgi:hypothetical protein